MGLLFESPTCFAIFRFSDFYLRQPNAKKEITCVHNEIVMELMWGIQHLMHKFLPEEKVEVAKEERLPKGLKMLLRCYGFDVKPEMVNDQIVETAGDLFECDAVGKLFSSYLRNVRLCLKNTSGINCENWDNLKLATSLIVIFGPEEDDFFREVLSEDEVSKLMDDTTASPPGRHRPHLLCSLRNPRSIVAPAVPFPKPLPAHTTPCASSHRHCFVRPLVGVPALGGRGFSKLPAS